MTKRIAFFLVLTMLLLALTGCTGTPVIYMTNCECPTAAPATATPEATAEPAATAEPVETAAPAVEEAPAEAAELMTGLYIGAGVGDSKSASADASGEAKYDVTVVAVAVDGAGVIQSCIIDSIGASVAFDAAGAITSDTAAEVKTKNELGEAYGMKAYAGSKYEWNEQAAALADYAVGKTVEELKNGAVNESGKAKDADLASTATIYIGGYVAGIEAAVANAQAHGAKVGDELRLAIIPSLSSSAAATAEKAGTAQLDVDAAVLTISGETITSCHIDSMQAKVAFDAAGAVTTDLDAPIQTKNQLGEAYGMKAYAGSKFEWNEQAAAFADYVEGKTAAEVAGIAVNEKTAPTDADLASTVTIAVGGFQALVAKAAR